MEYTILHEVKHLIDFKKMGYDEYRKKQKVLCDGVYINENEERADEFAERWIGKIYNKKSE